VSVHAWANSGGVTYTFPIAPTLARLFIYPDDELDGMVRETSSVLKSESAYIRRSRFRRNSHSLQETQCGHK
jgi:hypothetical protein